VKEELQILEAVQIRFLLPLRNITMLKQQWNRDNTGTFTVSIM